MTQNERNERYTINGRVATDEEVAEFKDHLRGMLILRLMLPRLRDDTVSEVDAAIIKQAKDK